MKKFLILVLTFLYIIGLSACLTTQGNLPQEEKSFHVPEICELRRMEPESHRYIWLINKQLPLPDVNEKHKDKNQTTEIENSRIFEVLSTHEVDPNGLPLPIAPAAEGGNLEKAVSKNENPAMVEPQLKSAPSEISQPAHPVNYNSTVSIPDSPEVENKAELPLYETEVWSEIAPINQRNIFARQGDDIEVVFDNAGWIYLGFADYTDEDGLRYISKQSKEGKTLFYFKALQLGVYNLSFQLQDNISGTLLRELIAVKVITEDEFSSFLQNDSPVSSAHIKERDLSFAHKLFELGQFKDSLAEYLKFYQEGDSFLNQRLAEIYFILKDYRRSIHYWKKNLHAGGEYFEKAVTGLSQAYMGTDNYNELVSHMRYLFTENNVPQENDLVTLAKYFKSRNSDALAFVLLGEYMKYYPYGSNIDQIYYLLGVLYEKDTQFRDLKKSRNYYQKVLDEYPESFYADSSSERVNYLNRHFFYVR